MRDGNGKSALLLNTGDWIPKSIRLEFVDLVYSLLNDDNGISEEAYNTLRSMADSFGIDPKLFDRVDATDGRFYFKLGDGPNTSPGYDHAAGYHD